MTAASCGDPVLVIAPHLTYPTRNGADIAIDRRWGELSRFVSHVDIVGADCLVRYEAGRITNKTDFPNKSRGKLEAGLRTILLWSHYNSERFLTPGFVRESRAALAKREYQAVIYSYLNSASVGRDLRQKGRKEYVLSHNDDIRYFRHIRARTGLGFHAWLAAWFSEAWVRRNGRRWDNLRYIHCTSLDAAGWEQEIGPHSWLLGEVGCDLPQVAANRHEPLSQVRPVRLMFVGSLSVAMNGDAIRNFERRYLPTLRSNVPNGVTVRIAGSNPPSNLVDFCDEVGFNVYPNVSDDELAILYDWADFTILPFEYSTGTKLKLLGSTARGVPALMTTEIGGGPGSDHRLCLASDDPAAWAEHILTIQQNGGITEEDRAELRALSEPCSWTSMAKHFYETELTR